MSAFLAGQASHVLQTLEPTVLCSSLRLVLVDSSAVSLLTYIFKTRKTFTLSGRDKSCVRAHSLPYLAHHDGDVMS